jgi:Transcriptional regulator
MTAPSPVEPATLSPRQRAVLAVALDLLVEGGDKALTTAGLARAAGCSKESLYKWFGDRDGLLAAIVAFQASKVRTLAPGAERLSAEEFRRRLTVFAEDLLTVLSSRESLALNRLAIGEAGRAGARLGPLLMERGRRTIETRARALLELGRAQGHLAFSETGAAWGALYGLVVRDTHVRLLLGAAPEGDGEVAAQAATAIDAFFRLFGAGRD